MQEWINIKKRKPAIGERVLFISNEGWPDAIIYIGVFDSQIKDTFYTQIDGIAYLGGNYWMPLPALPTFNEAPILPEGYALMELIDKEVQ